MVSQTICADPRPDSSRDGRGLGAPNSGAGRSGNSRPWSRSGRSPRSRRAVGAFPRRFSHTSSSLRNEPSAQTIRLQWSPSALKPCSQTSGQTRPCLSLIASRASRLAVLTSNFVPALRLNSDSERCDPAPHSPSIEPVKQPTRFSSVCISLASSSPDGGLGNSG